MNIVVTGQLSHVSLHHQDESTSCHFACRVLPYDLHWVGVVERESAALNTEPKYKFCHSSLHNVCHQSEQLLTLPGLQLTTRAQISTTEQCVTSAKITALACIKVTRNVVFRTVSKLGWQFLVAFRLRLATYSYYRAYFLLGKLERPMCCCASVFFIQFWSAFILAHATEVVAFWVLIIFVLDL